MDYGLVLPNLGAGATPEGLRAAVEAAEDHGFTDVWTTDHVLIDRENAVRLRAPVRGDHHPRLARRALPRDSPRDQRHRRADAQRGRPGQGARDGRCPLGRAPDRRLRGRLEHEGVRERRRCRQVPRARRAISTRRSRSAATCGPATLRRSAGGSTNSTSSRSSRCPPRAATCRSGSGPATSGRSGGSVALADAYHASATKPAAYAPRIPIIRAAAEAAGRPDAAGCRLACASSSTAAAESFYTMHGSAGRRGRRDPGFRGARRGPSRAGVPAARSRWHPPRRRPLHDRGRPARLTPTAAKRRSPASA